MTVKNLLLCAAALLIGASLMARSPESVEFEYPDAHDPVAAFCDGRYYVFTTGMGIMSSDDLTHWRFEGRVLEETPEWAADKGFRGMPWAPDVQFHDGLYYVYYSYSHFGRNLSAIGVATNKTLNPESPDYRWEDQGMIVESVPGRDEWNAIDANVIVDENGTGWLAFGSFWRGIKMFRLDETMTRIAEPQEWYPLCRRPEGTTKKVSGGEDGIEHDPRGREAASTYNVVVGRAAEVTGPYLDKEGKSLMEGAGTVVARGDGRYAGVGHCAVVNFDGKDYMFMHGYDKEYDYRSKLLIREISWTPDGWPEIKL